jgi:uncharacterized membrane protein YeaQ/YmgE (transglycosylase-associated protein family)
MTTRMTTPKRPPPPRSRSKSKSPAKTGLRLPIKVTVDHEALAQIDKRAVAAQIGIGVVAGWLASWLVGGSGLLRYVITGLVGSIIGGAILDRSGLDLGIRSTLVNRIVTATLGAVVMVLLARLIA